MTSYIPSPTVGVLHLGPLPVRMYALCILIGIVVAVWLTGRRLVPRGGEPGQVLDVAAWAVLFGMLFFAEPVQPLTVFGAAMIVAACLYAARRTKATDPATGV